MYIYIYIYIYIYMHVKNQHQKFSEIVKIADIFLLQLFLENVVINICICAQ